MRNGLLRVLDIPEKVEGHGKVNLREEALKIAEGLFKTRERGDFPVNANFYASMFDLSPKIGCTNPKYYDKMIQVYEDILMMTNDIMECQDSSQVDELTRNVEDYIDEAKKQKQKIK